MHVMRNLGKWKKPVSRIFGVPAPAGSLLGLVQPFCAFYTFYHVLLFSLSHAYRLFLCYALLHRFVCNSFIPVSIYAPLYNISCYVYSLRLWLFICFCVDIALRVSIRSFLWMLLYVWLLTAYNANYKDLWRYPVKPYRAIGPWIVLLDVLCGFKYRLINRRFSHQILPRYLPESHPVQRP